MIKSIIKLSLSLTSLSFIGYITMNSQQKQNIYGFYRSVNHSSQAILILIKSISDYYFELSQFQYNSLYYHKKRSQIHSRVANRILNISQHNKGIYLKLGQYIGNLDKLVPWQFTDVLHILQDSAPSIQFKEIKITLENDLKRTCSSLFSSFQEKPVAAASLAQVHKAIMMDGQQVAVKIQYPFLLSQSKYDLIFLRIVTKFCNYLLKLNDYKEINLLKLFDDWTNTITEELNFKSQMSNALATKNSFKSDKILYIPTYYKNFSSQRIIVMEFINGVKINQKDKIEELGINTKNVAKQLVRIFTEMIFKIGFVHCDAHPGNILVRKYPNERGFQIILLDHGLYQKISGETLQNFSGLWLNLLSHNSDKAYIYAKKMNIQKHLQLIPVIFFSRLNESKKMLGDTLTLEEKKQLQIKDLVNFKSINEILQDLPPELTFIIRASNLISIHNFSLGGNNRERILQYTKCALNTFFKEPISYYYHYVTLSLKVWLFQNVFTFYKLIFGFQQCSEISMKQQNIFF